MISTADFRNHPPIRHVHLPPPGSAFRSPRSRLSPLWAPHAPVLPPRSTEFLPPPRRNGIGSSDPPWHGLGRLGEGGGGDGAPPFPPAGKSGARRTGHVVQPDTLPIQEECPQRRNHPLPFPPPIHDRRALVLTELNHQSTCRMAIQANTTHAGPKGRGPNLGPRRALPPSPPPPSISHAAHRAHPGHRMVVCPPQCSVPPSIGLLAAPEAGTPSPPPRSHRPPTAPRVRNPVLDP